MSWDYGALQAKAQKLYQTAMDTELGQQNIYRDGDRYYSDTDTTSGSYTPLDTTDDNQPYNTDAEVKQKVDAAAAKFADVPNIFIDWQMFPQPASFSGPISQCEQAMYKVSAEKFDNPVGSGVPGINTELSTLTAAGRNLTEWDGLAATAFVDQVVTPFAGRMSNMFTAIGALRAAYKAEQAIWEPVPDRLNKMADQAQHAMENCYECSADDWGLVVDVCSLLSVVPVPIVNVIGTIGAAAANRNAQAAGTAPSGAEGTAKQADVIGKACSVVSSAVDVASKGTQLAKDADKHGSADDPASVIKQLKDGLDALKKSLQTGEQKISQGMKDALGMLQNPEYRPDFIPGRPALIDAKGDQGLLGNPNQSGRTDVTWP